MDALRLSTMSSKPLDATGKERVRGEKMAEQFEQIFVRTMVSSLRQTSKLDEGGMFGSGPGSDTFGDWFDQNLAEQIGRESDVGIAEALLVDIKRHAGQATQGPADSIEAKAAAAKAAADRSYHNQTTNLGNGGFDVVL